MATILKGKLARESTDKIDDREIIIILDGENQSITLKLKGTKKQIQHVGVKELWDMLSEELKPKKSKKVADQVEVKDGMISLHRLRSLNATTPSTVEALAKLDEIIVELLNNNSWHNKN